MPVAHDRDLPGSTGLACLQHSDHLSEAKEDQSTTPRQLLRSRHLAGRFQDFVQSLLLEVARPIMDRLQPVWLDTEVRNWLSAVLDQSRADLPNQVQPAAATR